MVLTSLSAEAETLRLAVTTSFNNSGLSDVLLPAIKADTGLDVQMLIVGTGQALTLGRNGDVDAILVHSKRAEEKFVAEGYGTHRRDIMYNDFVLIGPQADPAGIADARTVADALNRISANEALFLSRGDDSGTHRREIALWEQAGATPERSDASWYREAGAGMGATLNTASGLNAYVLADRASWLNFGNKGDLKLLFAGDERLFNQYGYLPVDPARHPHVKADAAMRLEDWLISDKGQQMISDYRIVGQQVFTPNASPRLN